MKSFILAVFLAATTGCFEMHVRDETTIKNVDKTIINRLHDWDLIEKQLETPTPTARDIRGLKALNDSELDRLTQWKEYEESKAVIK